MWRRPGHRPGRCHHPPPGGAGNDAPGTAFRKQDSCDPGTRDGPCPFSAAVERAHAHDGARPSPGARGIPRGRHAAGTDAAVEGVLQEEGMRALPFPSDRECTENHPGPHFSGRRLKRPAGSCAGETLLLCRQGPADRGLQGGTTMTGRCGGYMRRRKRSRRPGSGRCPI